MVSRRDFLKTSTLASSALLLANPLLSFASLDEKSEQELFDVIIVGGSYSGLSAALALGRSLRRVLILDSNEPCNRMATHSHNFLTQDGNPPGGIGKLGKEQVEKYETVFFHLTKVNSVEKQENQTFTVTTDQNKNYASKYVLFATGMKDEMLPIKGYEACWGKSILHCPYCHGYEERHKSTTILANGDVAFHYAMLVSNLTDKLTILTNGTALFKTEQQNILAKNKVQVIQKQIKELNHQNGKVSEIIFQDNTTLFTEAIYSRPPAKQHCDIPEKLGCELTEQGLLKINAKQETTIQGIYSCGDTSSFRSVATAVATGSATGMSINAQLCQNDFMN
ncbi:NAD(P)/FAD-dependent oxidoreductase [Myroides sp. N17-2]|uniref:NAD(P)/FAD-dependent oxidoreductase n=1 Tax=Myroides sp. N17-2 TaxID=2030799 RepID=UPI000EFB1797|nr:FAD-dependent oxidoreductase [Myroides sp. N17-2]